MSSEPFRHLTIESSLQACAADSRAYDSWVDDRLSKDPLGALVESWSDMGSGPGELAGMPVLVKDNMCVEGRVTACGSRYLSEFKSLETATAVARLQEAGCRLVGRTNMDEFAMGSSTEHSAFGPTRNPWDLERVPGGSSGGAAAAVAAGWVPASLGSDTGGSVRQPAALCGVVGFKPTYGYLSRRGLVAFASSLDQIGTFTRNVEDAARLMAVMSGGDPLDSTSLEGPDDWSLSIPDPTTLRVGVLKERWLEGLQSEIRRAHDATASWFREQGATLVEVDIPHFDKALNVYYIVALAEASANLARYDGVRYGRRSPDTVSMDDMFTLSREQGLGDEVKRRILMGTHVLSSGYWEAYYGHARRVQRIIRDGFDAAFGAVDVIVTPTTRKTAFRFGERADPVEMYKSDWYTVGANLSGLPGVSVPAGLDDSGLPIGMQFLGPREADTTVLSVAALWESAHPFSHRCPDV